MFKSKKWLLLLIIGFPSLFWIILESATINSKKLPYYGPKKVIALNDTLYHSVKTVFENTKTPFEFTNYDTINFPVFAILFIKGSYKKESYRINGLWEYMQYKKSKIEHIPFVFVTETQDNLSITETEIFNMTNATKNIFFSGWRKSSFDSINKIYFKEKPYYIDYSFIVLVDKNRNIRGFYDGRYVAEVKRLIGEYQHLRIKEEKKQIINANEIIAR